MWSTRIRGHDKSDILVDTPAGWASSSCSTVLSIQTQSVPIETIVNPPEISNHTLVLWKEKNIGMVLIKMSLFSCIHPTRMFLSSFMAGFLLFLRFRLIIKLNVELASGVSLSLFAFSSLNLRR